MSDYKPSFVFQSKISSESINVNNENLQVAQQADQSNTMGGVEVLLGPYIGFGPYIVNEIFQWNTQIISTIAGGLISRKDLFDNPDFQCSIVLAAAELACGQIQACPAPKEIMAIKKVVDEKTKKTTIEVDCGCPDKTSKDIISEASIIEDFLFGEESGDSDLQSILDNAVKCLRKTRNEAFKTCVGSSLNGIYQDMTPNNGNVPWNGAVDLIRAYIDQIINDENIDPIQKASMITDQLNMLNQTLITNGWDIDNPEAAELFADASNRLQKLISDCGISVGTDCKYNTIPSKEHIKAVLQTMSRKPEKQCPKVTESNTNGAHLFGKTLDHVCECVCASGIPCPDEDYCLDCSGMNGIFKYTPGNPLLPFDNGKCECVCPEGQRRYKIDGELSPCVPECSDGLVFVEVPCNGESVIHTNEEGKCYGCACRKNVGNILWPRYETITNEYCASLWKNGIMDPNNNCECVCPSGWSKLANPDGNIDPPYYKCLPPCPEGSRRQYDSEQCVCYDYIQGVGVVDEPCPSGTTTNPENPCECICNDPYKKWSTVDKKCVCKVPPKLNPAWGHGCAETAYEILYPDTCECVCPKDYCKNDGIAIPKGSDRTNNLRCECACVNICPQGTLIAPNCDCIACVDGNCSGAVGVASYTTNMIPNKLNGYSIIENL